jgi:7-cyano-7-deazaguanine reductase
MKDDVSKLNQLGSNQTDYKYDEPSIDILETFFGQGKEEYTIDLSFDEFTSLCPKTGQPDFAKVKIRYIPDKLCVETKSLKLYLFAFRNHGGFMETTANIIRQDLLDLLRPKYLRIEMNFKPRGGVANRIVTVNPVLKVADRSHDVVFEGGVDFRGVYNPIRSDEDEEQD